MILTVKHCFFFFLVLCCLVFGMPWVLAEGQPLEVTAVSEAFSGPPGIAHTLLDPGEGAYWPGLSPAELLARVPGLQVTRTGGRGGLGSLYVRGGGSGDTLFLLDGVPLNEPNAPGNAFDLSLLDPVDLERLELLRGPGAHWSGPPGLGGVVHLRGARGAGDTAGSLFLDTLGGGSGRFAFGIGDDRAALRVGLGVVGARDYVADPAAGHRERDEHLQYTLQLRPSWRPVPGLELGGTLRWSAADTDLDDYTVGVVDDADYRQRRRRGLVSLRLLHRPSGGTWEQRFLLWHVRGKHHFENGPAQPDSDGEPFSSVLNGRREGLSWNLAWRPAAGHRGLLELEAERQRLGGIAGARGLRRGARLAWRLDVRRYAVEAGLRLVRLRRAGTVFTWNLNGRLQTPLPGLSLLGAAGSTLQAPSLFSLYDPRYGNPGLRAERGVGWDAGLAYRLSRLSWEGRFYSTRLRDRLDFMEGRYLNLRREKLRGVETALKLQASPGLRLYADYTLSLARAAGRALPRRGYARLNVGARWRRGALDLGVHLRHEGRRRGLNGRLPSYTVLALRAGRRLRPRLEVFLQVENSLNKDYQEIEGYWSPGLSVRAGLRLWTAHDS